MNTKSTVTRILLAPLRLLIRYGLMRREETYFERKFSDVYGACRSVYGAGCSAPPMDLRPAGPQRRASAPDAVMTILGSFEPATAIEGVRRSWRRCGGSRKLIAGSTPPGCKSVRLFVLRFRYRRDGNG